jgi:HPt (histidine-containing phosphotransfer) domain-containing protein
MTMNTEPPLNSPDSRVPESAPIVVAELSERCMGNALIAAMVLEKFEAQLRSDVPELEQRLRDGRADQFARIAHALKAAGAAAAKAVYGLAARVEQTARESRLGSIATELDALKGEIARCLAYLPEARAALSGPRGSGVKGDRG